MTGPAALVEIEGVSRAFTRDGRAVPALREVSARVPEGSLTGLIGADGAGKTSLMRLIAGLLRPDSGQLRVFGAPPLALDADRRRAIGYLPQGAGLYSDLSVAENLRLHADLRGLAGPRREARMGELLERLDLAPFRARPAGKLSGGMAQKLGLACALVVPPRLLLLDEPTTGVDPLSRRELREIVRGLVEDGITVLWSTAYLDEAEGCDRVIVLDAGETLFEGDPEAFAARAEGRVHDIEPDGLDLRALQRRVLAEPGVLDAVLRAGRLRVVTAPGTNLDALESLREAGEAAPARPRFEDALIAGLAQDRTEVPAAPAAAPGDGDDGPAIRAEGLVRRFGDFTAVAGVSFEVARGEVFGLLGPNGAGKSTIFKMLCGLLPPSEGEARVAGRDLRRAPGEARARIGYMAQRFSLYGELSVRRNLDFFAAAYGLGRAARRERIGALLEELSLAPHADQPAGGLPLGLKQRVSLAAAILHQPGILFLDEPTSGVDPLVRREFWLRINAMAERGVAVLVTTHFMEEAEYCGRLAIVERGEIIATGAPRELAEAHAPQDIESPSVEDAFVALIRARRQEARAA
ncbi:MAG: ATP-binding cassette domain-containing protein [Pseudomonadota bacterium]